MKKLSFLLLVLIFSNAMMAQGWPENYKGVMLQGFFWNSHTESRWKNLEAQADELSQYFQLVWIPQSGNCNGTSMGYDDLYWFPGSTGSVNHYLSTFGTETQLRNMINTFKSKGIGTIADVVINHRKTISGWFGFPTEAYKGITYSMSAADVCKNDDGGAAKTQADKQGVSLSENNDTGEGWDGMRDLDHKSKNVQTVVKAYLHMLLEDLGYTGFRYDMVKGYSGTYTGMYNADSKPEFSVGEYWDGNASVVKSWINSTKVDNVIQSAAFDFPFRYTVRDACNNSNWSKLANSSLASDANYRRYGVTFIENHDTEYRSASDPQDPIKKDTLAGNAHMLAMPGTPCVFFKHWIDLKGYIKPMIEARQLAGISNTSSYNRLLANSNCYAYCTDDRLIAVLGNTSNYTPTEDGWIKILDGYHYAYYVRNTVANTAWVSHASGKYKGDQKVVLSAITTQNAKMVYTLDGSEPTASSPSVASGEKVTIPAGTSTDSPIRTTTLKAAMLINGAISGNIITRTYEVEYVEPYDPYTIDVYVNTDNVSWTNCYFHSFGDYRTGTAWPGTNITDKQTINEKVWYHNQYTISSKNDYVQFVFNTNSGSKQSVDSEKIKATTYFTVLNEKDTQGHYKLQTSTTGIQNVQSSKLKVEGKFFTLDGRYAGSDYTTLPRGIYISNGKKVMK